jgi:hypothetical protein
MSLLTRKRKILAKLETTYGTDSTPAAATDGVLLRSLTVTPLDITYDERTLIRGYLGGFQQVVGMSMVKIEVELEMAGFGTAGPAAPTPGYDALLRSCALQRVVTAGTKVDYNPISTLPFDSITVYYEIDGVIQKATGCRGTLTLDMQTGKIPSYKITLTGVYAGVADGSLGTPVTSAYQLPRAVNSQNTTGFNLLGLSSGVLRSFSFDLGNTVAMTSYVGESETVRITDRQSTGKISIQRTPVATEDWLSQVLNLATGAFAIVHGPTTNQVQVLAPAVQITTPTESDDNGVAFLDFDLRFLPVAGNDEVQISIR